MHHARNKPVFIFVLTLYHGSGMTPRVKAGSHKKNSKEAARRWKDIAKNIKVLTAHCRLDQELAAL